MATSAALTTALVPSQTTAGNIAAAPRRIVLTAEQLETYELWGSLPGLTLKGQNRVPLPANRRRGLVAPVAFATAGGGGVSESGDGKSAAAPIIHGKCFVVRDNIDTDQIIPAEYLTLVPSKPDEYEKLGTYAMIGLPAHYGKFIEPGEGKTEYTVMIAGANFGCGSSREHAPVAMRAAGARVVVAESYARIFFRNSVSTGEIYPVESQGRVCEENQTGDLVTVDMENDVLINHTSGKQFPLKPIGDAGPVIAAGGIFNFARASGMIASV